MTGLSTPVLTGQLQSTGQTRFNQTSANLSFNGLLIDVSFTVPASYNSGWDFLKELFLSVTLRLGKGDGGAIALVSNASLWGLINYSDYIAGVSLSGTDFKQDQVARISGYVDFGFYSMGSRDALEVSLSVADASSYESISGGIDFNLSTVHDKSTRQFFKMYQSSKPTGADQPYRNVQNVFYMGDDVVNKSASINTAVFGSQNVNIEDAIALSNATGNFEFFTRFGQLFEEEFGLSTDVTLRVPDDDAESELLIVQYGFFPEILLDSDSGVVSRRNALIEYIKTEDPNKYQYISELGIA